MESTICAAPTLLNVPLRHLCGFPDAPPTPKKSRAAEQRRCQLPSLSAWAGSSFSPPTPHQLNITLVPATWIFPLPYLLKKSSVCVGQVIKGLDNAGNRGSQEVQSGGRSLGEPGKWGIPGHLPSAGKETESGRAGGVRDSFPSNIP